MDKTFQRFLGTGINLAPVGIERCDDNAPYFCTPKGASIFGWAGIDGIHFCFIRGFGEMIFSVSPMNTAPNYVHPLAKNFMDFLRLLLACGDVAALEQAWMWDETQFEAFLQENPPTQEQQRTLSEVAVKMKLMPMNQPWVYIKALQSSFDTDKLKYTDEYYDIDMNPADEPVLPEWKVYFDGNFWRHHGKDHAGTEIRLDKQFDWAGHHWVVPSAYACGKGLVIDFCMRVDVEEIRSFMKKWNLSPENDSCENFTHEQQMKMESDNPMCLNYNFCLELNGKTIRFSHGCSVSYNPCLPDGMMDELEAKWAVTHYDLDKSCGWVICRNAFPWGSKHRPIIKTLSLTMEQQPDRISGPHFRIHAPGDLFTFSHPVSGAEYILTVQELEQRTIPQNRFDSNRWLFPTHFVVMSYTLFPEPVEIITVCDCAESDKPMEIAQGEDAIAGVAIIGGAGGPTAIVLGGTSQEQLHTACSSLHFEPVRNDVEWSLMFHIKGFDDASFLLI